MRLFIADANPDFRLALQVFLHQEPGMDVVGIATHSSGLLAQVEASRPDVLLLDWQLPDRALIEVTKDVRALNCPVNIVVTSVRPEERNTFVDSGADAYFEKTNQPEELLDYLRTLRDKECERDRG